MNTPQKVAVLGFDCALTKLVRKHIEEGICPNFKKVFEKGTVAENCLVPYPTITPPNWTSMATGAWPGTNNVTDFWRHIPGTTPEGANTHSAFNWDYVQAESIWEAAERVGKKSIILNWPMSYNVHKKLKHGVVVGGAALTTGVFMDNNFVAQFKGVESTGTIGASMAFCEDTLISTDVHPGNNIRINFVEAERWSHVDNLGDDPLEAAFDMAFSNSLFNMGTTYTRWYVLVQEEGTQGYDTVTLSPTKDMNDAFCTLKVGQWSEAFNTEGKLEKGGTKTIRLKAKLLSMDSEAESFKLYITAGLNVDGEAWCFPQEKAALLNKGDNVSTNNTGMLHLTMGWYGLKDWLEQIGIHYEWLGDTSLALLADGNWDLFFSHAHPTDYIYHVLMTELDPQTCSSRKMYEEAWEMHRELYRHADRYLGRLLEALGEDTLIILTSDHGATPDGPMYDMMDILTDAGLAHTMEAEESDYLKRLPESIRSGFARMNHRVDASRSRAIPQRACYVYVNLKGRDPEGIVEPEDYEKTQREIIEALMAYRHPETGKCPFCLALPKRDAMLLGLWGDQVGDVVYASWPEYSSQHGPILPTAQYGTIGDLRTLCVYYGPHVGIRQGFAMERVCNIVDLVPTICYLTGWPIPRTAEGSVVYQVLENPDHRP